jgi:hypothetical protein
MPKGERGTTKPYLRGKIWWIKYYVPGEDRPRYESSKSASKNDAIRLLNQRRSEIDSRQVSSLTATVGDLFKLYLADQRKQGGIVTSKQTATFDCILIQHSAKSKPPR